MTEREAYRALQVLPHAHPRVIRAAHAALRELVLTDPSDDAPRRLAEIDRAHVVLRGLGRTADPAVPRTVNVI